MTVCYSDICHDCSCGRAITNRTPANDNVAPAPRARVRRDPVDAAKALEKRFKDTMKILS